MTEPTREAVEAAITELMHRGRSFSPAAIRAAMGAPGDGKTIAMVARHTLSLIDDPEAFGGGDRPDLDVFGRSVLEAFASYEAPR